MSEATLILFAYYFPPLNESGAQRPFRFVRYLQPYGYQTRVITASQQGDGGPWRDVAEVPNEARLSGSARAGGWISYAVQRVLPYNDQLPWVPRAVVEAQQVIRLGRPAAILSTCPPVACHLAALALKLRFGLPWIADFRDPLYRNPHRSRTVTRPYEAVVERLVMYYADAVIANTDSAAEAMQRRYPRYSNKIHLIWNGYDPEQPLAPAPLPKREYKVLLHAGSLYGGRHPGVLLASLERLIGTGRLEPAAVRVRLVGWVDATRPWVASGPFQTLQERGCLERVDEVPQEDAIKEMAQADYLLLLDGNDKGVAVQVPAKLFQYIRIGRPVLAITVNNSPTERILAQSGIRYVAIRPDAADDEVDERVAMFFRLPTEPLRPSPWFEEQFNAEAQTKVLASILHSIVGKSGSAQSINSATNGRSEKVVHSD